MPMGTGIVTGAGAVFLGGVLMIGAAVYDAGAIRVSVDEKKVDGAHVHLMVPAAVVHMGLRFAPDECLRQASKDVHEFIPALRIATQELAKCPDFTFVEVDDDTDHVKIVKQSSHLVIDVNTSEEKVHVSVPLRTVMAAIREVESAGPSL